MKRVALFLSLLFIYGITDAQINCIIYPENSNCQKACEYYNKGISFPQGSRQSQLYFDSAISYCPTFAEPYREKSVPFLKRGLYAEWKRLIDKAVELQPLRYIGIRGWCLFKFLRDYKNAMADLILLDSLSKGDMGMTGDGYFALRSLLALCKRETGDIKGALAEFDKQIGEGEKTNSVKLYDYLLRGVTRLKNGDYAGAMSDLEKQKAKYPLLADTYYYIGKTFQAQGNYKLANENFIKSRELFTKSGYHQSDPYTSPPDAIYLADIDEALGAK
jgi:tetratricopeptide (TPR) repeat protein